MYVCMCVCMCWQLLKENLGDIRKREEVERVNMKVLAVSDLQRAQVFMYLHTLHTYIHTYATILDQRELRSNEED